MAVGGQLALKLCRQTTFGNSRTHFHRNNDDRTEDQGALLSLLSRAIVLKHGKEIEDEMVCVPRYFVSFLSDIFDRPKVGV